MAKHALIPPGEVTDDSRIMSRVPSRYGSIRVGALFTATRFLAHLVLPCFLTVGAQAQESSTLKITQAGTQEPADASNEHFARRVRIQSPFKGEAPARVGGATVTFSPDARTAWHSHPLG